MLKTIPDISLITRVLHNTGSVDIVKERYIQKPGVMFFAMLYARKKTGICPSGIIARAVGDTEEDALIRLYAQVKNEIWTIVKMLEEKPKNA